MVGGDGGGWREGGGRVQRVEGRRRKGTEGGGKGEEGYREWRETIVRDEHQEDLKIKVFTMT